VLWLVRNLKGWMVGAQDGKMMAWARYVHNIHYSGGTGGQESLLRRDGVLWCGEVADVMKVVHAKGNVSDFLYSCGDVIGVEISSRLIVMSVHTQPSAAT